MLQPPLLMSRHSVYTISMQRNKNIAELFKSRGSAEGGSLLPGSGERCLGDSVKGPHFSSFLGGWAGKKDF